MNEFVKRIFGEIMNDEYVKPGFILTYSYNLIKTFTEDLKNGTIKKCFNNKSEYYDSVNDNLINNNRILVGSGIEDLIKEMDKFNYSKGQSLKNIIAPEIEYSRSTKVEYYITIKKINNDEDYEILLITEINNKNYTVAMMNRYMFTYEIYKSTYTFSSNEQDYNLINSIYASGITISRILLFSYYFDQKNIDYDQLIKELYIHYVNKILKLYNTYYDNVKFNIDYLKYNNIMDVDSTIFCCGDCLAYSWSKYVLADFGLNKYIVNLANIYHNNLLNQIEYRDYINKIIMWKCGSCIALLESLKYVHKFIPMVPLQNINMKIFKMNHSDSGLINGYDESYTIMLNRHDNTYKDYINEILIPGHASIFEFYNNSLYIFDVNEPLVPFIKITDTISVEDNECKLIVKKINNTFIIKMLYYNETIKKNTSHVDSYSISYKSLINYQNKEYYYYLLCVRWIDNNNKSHLNKMALLTKNIITLETVQSNWYKLIYANGIFSLKYNDFDFRPININYLLEINNVHVKIYDECTIFDYLSKIHLDLIDLSSITGYNEISEIYKNIKRVYYDKSIEYSTHRIHELNNDQFKKQKLEAEIIKKLEKLDVDYNVCDINYKDLFNISGIDIDLLKNSVLYFRECLIAFFQEYTNSSLIPFSEQLEKINNTYSDTIIQLKREANNSLIQNVNNDLNQLDFKIIITIFKFNLEPKNDKFQDYIENTVDEICFTPFNGGNYSYIFILFIIVIVVIILIIYIIKRNINKLR